MEINIADFQDRHNEKTAIILGNGPSLTVTPLTALAETCVLFGSNHIFRLYEHLKFKCDYIVVTDKNRIKEMDPLAFSKYHVKLLYGDHTRVIPRIERCALFADEFIRLKMFLRRPFRRGLGLLLAKSMPTKIKKYLACESRFMSVDLENGLNFGESVIFSSIQLAYYAGCKRIVLAGVDADYKIKQYPDGIQDNVVYTQKAFMENPRLLMEPLLTSFKITLEGLGVELVDGTINGRLQCLKKIDIESIIRS